MQRFRGKFPYFQFELLDDSADKYGNPASKRAASGEKVNADSFCARGCCYTLLRNAKQAMSAGVIADDAFVDNKHC